MAEESTNCIAQNGRDNPTRSTTTPRTEETLSLMRQAACGAPMIEGIEGGDRYLVVRLTALGDILHTLPAVAAIRAAHKNARSGWVVDRKWAPVLEGSPAISEVIPFDCALVFGALTCARRLRQKDYTCAIDF